MKNIIYMLKKWFDTLISPVANTITHPKYLIQSFKVAITVFSIFSLFSCQKLPTISYFDSADSIKYQILPQNLPNISLVNKEDILAITIVSLSQETNQILNFNNAYGIGSAGVTGGQSAGNQSLGFLVDNNGDVELPLLGKVNLIGLSLESSATKIRTEVEKILKNPSVNVRFMNHRFSILGEVSRPGVYSLVNDRTTIADALALAGDLGQYANRNNLMLVRNNGTKREMVKLDLTKKEIFASPYFYIKDGDMIYIEPLRTKTALIDRRLQFAPLILSGVSALGIIINLLLK